MSNYRQPFASTLLLFSVFCFGCGQSQPVADSKSDNEDGFVDELLADLEPAGKTAQLADAADPLSPVAKAAPGERLELRLQTGDRFPLVKTIEQSLVQKPAQYAATAHTRLDLHMVIQVNQVRDDAILMNVRYTRVFYEHDVSGHRMIIQGVCRECTKSRRKKRKQDLV